MNKKDQVKENIIDQIFKDLESISYCINNIDNNLLKDRLRIENKATLRKLNSYVGIIYAKFNY